MHTLLCFHAIISHSILQNRLKLNPRNTESENLFESRIDFKSNYDPKNWNQNESLDTERFTPLK